MELVVKQGMKQVDWDLAELAQDMLLGAADLTWPGSEVA